MPNNQGPIIDSGQRQKDEKRKEQKLVSEAKNAMNSTKNYSENKSGGAMSDYSKNAATAAKRPTLSSASERHAGIGSISRPDTPLANTPEPKK